MKRLKKMFSKTYVTQFCQNICSSDRLITQSLPYLLQSGRSPFCNGRHVDHNNKKKRRSPCCLWPPYWIRIKTWMGLNERKFICLCFGENRIAVAEWLATHSRGVNFAGGEIGTSRCGSLHRFVGVVTDLGARSHDTSCESYS